MMLSRAQNAQHFGLHIKSPILTEFECFLSTFVKSPTPTLTKVRPVVVVLLQTNGQTDRHYDAKRRSV